MKLTAAWALVPAAVLALVPQSGWAQVPSAGADALRAGAGVQAPLAGGAMAVTFPCTPTPFSRSSPSPDQVNCVMDGVRYFAGVIKPGARVTIGSPFTTFDETLQSSLRDPEHGKVTQGMLGGDRDFALVRDANDPVGAMQMVDFSADKLVLVLAMESPDAGFSGEVKAAGRLAARRFVESLSMVNP